ncbi:MAG: OmpP1/FadL family transporter [Acidobacteriota bacterium]
MKLVLVLALVLVLDLPSTAGGLGRPNSISARGVGLGGAFAALADDATALYFNPGALADIDPQATVGGELVVGPRSYTPTLMDGSQGPKQSATVVAPLPALGAVYRFTDSDDRPSPITFGVGVWNTFGGKVSFPKSGTPALDSTEDAAIEASAGVAYRVSDKLAVGGALRLGVGLFAADATMMPYDSQLSGSGVGLAVAAGALVKPTDTLRVAVAWRSPLHIETDGSGTIQFPGGASQEQFTHAQKWPQQASLGVALVPDRQLRVAAQLDWSQWSTVQELAVRFPANAALDQIYPEAWRDTWTVRAGAEYAFTSALAARAGAYYDTSAVPDRSLERQYLDSNKVGVAAGASVRAAGWRVDAALDLVLPSTRTVPDNTSATTAFPADRNKAPGSYSGTLVTVELAVAHPL